MGYFSLKCVHGSSRAFSVASRKKLDEAVLKFQRKNLFTKTASEFDNVKAWKMSERLKINPSFEAGKL